MPLVKVNMLKGKTKEYKKTVLDCIHSGLMEAIGINDWDRFQRIDEYESEDFETAPSKTDKFMIIEITLFPGRSSEMKEKAIQLITEKLSSALVIEPTDIFIIFVEPPLENWGMGGIQKK